MSDDVYRKGFNFFTIRSGAWNEPSAQLWALDGGDWIITRADDPDLSDEATEPTPDEVERAIAFVESARMSETDRADIIDWIRRNH